jgi:hypothetical protein
MLSARPSQPSLHCICQEQASLRRMKREIVESTQKIARLLDLCDALNKENALVSSTCARLSMPLPASRRSSRHSSTTFRPRCPEQGKDKRTEVEEIAKDNERCEPTVRPYASVPLVNCSAVSISPVLHCLCDFAAALILIAFILTPCLLARTYFYSKNLLVCLCKIPVHADIFS